MLASKNKLNFVRHILYLYRKDIENDVFVTLFLFKGLASKTQAYQILIIKNMNMNEISRLINLKNNFNIDPTLFCFNILHSSQYLNFLRVDFCL